MAGGTILSVNVTRARDVLRRRQPDRTASFKAPRQGRVGPHAHQLEGDEQADRRVHGGPEMAAYAYAREDTDWWEGQLGKPLVDGLFGENLTLRGVDIGAARVGERWRAGNTVVEVTKPRSPCWKLGLRMQDASFPRAFRSGQCTGSSLAGVEACVLA